MCAAEPRRVPQAPLLGGTETAIKADRSEQAVTGTQPEGHTVGEAKTAKQAKPPKAHRADKAETVKKTTSRRKPNQSDECGISQTTAAAESADPLNSNIQVSPATG